MDKNLKSDQMNMGIKNGLKETLWVDVLQRQLKLWGNGAVSWSMMIIFIW